MIERNYKVQSKIHKEQIAVVLCNWYLSLQRFSKSHNKLESRSKQRQKTYCLAT